MRKKLYELKTLNKHFYELIKSLQRNNFKNSARITSCAYEEFLYEIHKRLRRKLN